MKVLVMVHDVSERAGIQSALERSRHEVFPAESVEEALRLIETNRPRLVIVDDDIGSEPRSELIARARASAQPPIYLLSITSATQSPLDTDDSMHKPFTVSELAWRVSLAERFLALGDSLSEARTQIESMPLYDNLTGLMNQSAFSQTAQGELERARRASAPFSVISLELDNFRPLNGGYGAKAGDRVLKAVAITIGEKCRPYDCIGRWTDDEFMIALAGVIGEDAEKIAERIIKGVLAREIVSDGQPVSVGLSAGIASMLRISASTELQPLIEQARQARARARENGGNQVYLTFI
jgi:diguanylate cyclase (GGDEF)-like protein